MALKLGELTISITAADVTEELIAEWFTCHSSAAVRRVIDRGEAVITERAEDGVFE